MHRLRVNIKLDCALRVRPASRLSTVVDPANGAQVSHRHGISAVPSVIGHAAGRALTSVERCKKSVSVHCRNQFDRLSTRVIDNMDKGGVDSRLLIQKKKAIKMNLVG